MNLEEIKKIPVKELLEKINNVKKKIKKSDIVKNLFDEYEVNLDELDIIPMCFADIPVSARTEKGVIYFNYKLLLDDDFSNDDHYMVHEVTHWLQQTTGTKGTPGFTDDTYLDDKYEQEGFQNQSKYLNNTKGKEEAEEYIDKVLDHHQLEGNKRKNIKKKILNTKEAGFKESGATVVKLHKGRLEELIKDISIMTSAGDAHAIAISRMMNLINADIEPIANANNDQETIDELDKLKEIYQDYKNNYHTPTDYHYLMSLAIRIFVRHLKDKNY